MVATHPASGFRTDEVCGVRNGLKDHFAGGVSDSTVGIAGCIIEEVLDGG